MIHSIKILFKVEENSASEQFVVHIALDRINNIQNCMLSRHIFTKTILAIVQKSMVSLHPILRLQNGLSMVKLCSVLVPGHDQPIDITIFMDIQPQPGPNTSDIRSAAILHLNQHHARELNRIENTRTLLYYSRNQLLDLRRSSIFEGQSTLFTTLKECGIFRYRGTRGGRRKIPTIVSNRFARAHCSSPTQRNVNLANLTAILQTPFTPSGSPNRFKPTDFCLINARSINNKSFFIKDFVVDHDLDILAITETWTQPDLFE